MEYISKVKNKFNRTLLFVLACLFPLASQAIESYEIIVNTHSYYFFIEEKASSTDTELIEAIAALQALLSKPNSYCVVCHRFSELSFFIPGTYNMKCSKCVTDTGTELAKYFNEQLQQIYTTLKKFAYDKNEKKRTILLRKSTHDTSQVFDISKIKPKDISEITSITPILLGSHPIPNDSAILHTRQYHYSISPPDKDNVSHIFQRNSDSSCTRKHRIHASTILAFELDEENDVLICVVIFESTLCFMQRDSKGEFISKSFQGYVTETDIPTVQVFIADKTYCFIIENQEKLSLVTQQGDDFVTIFCTDKKLCPSVSYTDDDILYTYYTERSPDSNQVNIKEQTITLLEAKSQNRLVKSIDVSSDNKIECSLSLAPKNVLLAFNVKTNQAVETYLMALRGIKGEDISYKFTPEFSSYIKWHAIDLSFVQHTKSGRFTLIQLKRQDNYITLGPRREYETPLKNFLDVFVLDEDDLEDKKNGTLYLQVIDEDGQVYDLK